MTRKENMKINKLYSKPFFQSLFVVAAILLSLSVSFWITHSAAAAGKCGGVDTAIISCNEGGGGNIEQSGLMGLLRIVINIMALSVGVLAVGALVYAGILYASARDSQEQVQKAKDMIRNTIIGLILFAGMYSIVEFLIPKGVF